MHFDWLIPQWPAPNTVRALCTTRSGGVSAPPYDSLNLGDHVGDLATDVAHNRALLAQSVNAKPVFLSQVHGTDMLELTPDTPHGASADGVFTRQRALACTVMVADCLPILLCDVRGTWVAAVHAGWRGLAGVDGQGAFTAGKSEVAGEGVLEAIFKQYKAVAREYSAGAATELIAWLGPCIGPEAFEVGADVRQAFVAHDALAAQCFEPLPQGKWRANLPALARQRLQFLGLEQVYGNDGTPPWCTVGNPQRFFSHRRDRVSGRQAACVWLD